MTETHDVEKAERLGRWRARMFAAQAVLFVTWQGLYFLTPPETPLRSVDSVKLWTWLLWVAALLLLLATGGGLLRRKSLRTLLNDEFTRRNRAAAQVAGFWAAAGAGLLLYVVDLFEPVTGREAVHAILSVAIAAALLTFSFREGRSAA